jgi:hypothetical protein
MGAKVAFDALLDAFEFVSFEGLLENAAYVSLDTGRIFWRADDSSFEGEGRCDSRLLPPARSLREIQEPAGG